MAKKGDDIGSAILAGLAILGGALIFSEIVKASSKRVTVYSCPNCKYDKLLYGTTECPNCHAHLTWENQTQQA
ncbi:MAG TPA: hypothetical protein VK783_06545 [Bacteroidia bacterium]|jgi:hypothetical protein|nr:hypothetical protein [Bacteroidia bacterium]